MMRFLETRDISRVRELQGEFEWTFERDFMGALAVVDDDDQPVMIVGAWSRAEVHVLSDAKWKTPEDRMAAFVQIHAGMEEALRNYGVGEAITWMDDMKALGRRLKRLGWDMAKKTMWARRLL